VINDSGRCRTATTHRVEACVFLPGARVNSAGARDKHWIVIAMGRSVIAICSSGATTNVASERLYPIRRPIAAALAGAAVAVLGGLIGLGGAEFRLPILITMFALYANCAVKINLLISLATLAMSAVSRLGFVQATHAADFRLEIAGLLAGGVVAAWLVPDPSTTFRRPA